MEKTSQNSNSSANNAALIISLWQNSSPQKGSKTYQGLPGRFITSSQWEYLPPSYQATPDFAPAPQVCGNLPGEWSCAISSYLTWKPEGAGNLSLPNYPLKTTSAPSARHGVLAGPLRCDFLTYLCSCHLSPALGRRSWCEPLQQWCLPRLQPIEAWKGTEQRQCSDKQAAEQDSELAVSHELCLCAAGSLFITCLPCALIVF